MKCRMLDSIASADWSYKTNQVVTGGSEYGKDTVPAGVLAGWVERKLALPIPEQRVEAADSIETETAALAKPRGRTRGKKNG